ncbi:helix-turn-helix transcriptional regulator [Hymenobacter sp. BT662]|uniref:Helix-turn-helix transcriptional regulator n=2 Tax=Hymenobacter ruricola TaxID=2791023 RepID=A0ABS0HYV0_9BACT|nr:helix-turn-helix transcriptional regulator [Hymenobacter ruricola]
MIGSTLGPAFAFRCEAAGAGNKNPASAEQQDQHRALSNRTAAFNLRAHSKTQLIDNIRQAVADMVLAIGAEARLKNSEYLSRRLRYDYTYLANRFSETTGSTLEQYIIGVRINRVKELIIVGALNLTQIAYECQYSSVAHLSNQFKKVTGLTPSSFRMLHFKHGKVPGSVNDVIGFCNRVNALEVRRVSFVA